MNTLTFPVAKLRGLTSGVEVCIFIGELICDEDDSTTAIESRLKQQRLYVPYRTNGNKSPTLRSRLHLRELSFASASNSSVADLFAIVTKYIHKLNQTRNSVLILWERQHNNIGRMSLDLIAYLFAYLITQLPGQVLGWTDESM